MNDLEPTVLDFSDLQAHTRRLLDAARAELSRLDRERAEFIDRIEQLEVLLGERRVISKPRRTRIPTSTLKADVAAILQDAPGHQLSAANILKSLVDTRAYPRSRSLRTRVYASLSEWAGEADVIARVGRGQYKLV